MVNFAQAQYLLLLLLIPLFFVFYAVMLRFRRRRVRRFGDETLVKEIMPSRSASKGWVKVTLFAIAFFFFTIGMSRPQIGAKLKEHQTKGVEITPCLPRTIPPTVLKGRSWPFPNWWTGSGMTV